MAIRIGRQPVRPIRQAQRAHLPALLFSLLLLIGSSLPYLGGIARETPDWQFSGHVFGVEDGHSYLAKMRQGARGDFLFRLFYTAEPHPGVPLIFLPYMLTGWIVGRIVPETSPAHTDALIVGFHVFRLLSAAALLGALWRFTGRFVAAPRPRLTAFVIACVGGGLGWAVVLGGLTETLGTPPELYIPEGFGWLPIYGLPHIALGRAALLLGLSLILPAHPAFRRGTAAPTRRSSMLAGALWIVVGLCVPFYLAVLYVMLAAWMIGIWLRTRALPLIWVRRLLIPVALTLPFFGYFALAFTGNPAFARWSAQNILASPPPLLYALAYGPLALLALAGAPWIWKRAGRGRAGAMLLIAWPLIVPVLVYLPINVQRRLAEGVIVPLALLAAYGLERLGRTWVSVGVVFALSLSTLLMWGGGLFATLVAPPARPIFIPAGDIAALDWLHQHSHPGAVAVSTAPTGNLIPVYTHLRAYVGLGTETIAYTTRVERTDALFAGTLGDASALLDGACLPDDARLCTDPAAYILYLSAELALDREQAFAPPPGWRAIYTDETRIIFGR
jgi:hypothetical protein